MPTMPFYIDKIALKLTEKAARTWIKKNRPAATKLLYYALSQVFTIETLFAQASKDVLVVSALMRKRYDEIPTTLYKTAHTIYEETLSTIARVFLGAEVPSSALWRSSAAKLKAEEKEAKEQSKKLATLLTPRLSMTSNKDTNRERRSSQKTEQPPTKTLKTGDLDGWLKCDQPNLFVPKGVFPNDNQLCKSNARVDTECPYGEKCRNNHTHFNDMDRAQQKRIVKWVDNDRRVEFINIAEALLKALREEIAAGNDS